MTYFFFYVLTFVLFGRPQDYIPILGVIRPALIFSILTIFTSLFSGNLQSYSSLLSYKESKLYLAFFGTMFLGIPFAIYHKAAFDFVLFTYLIYIFYYFLFIQLVNSLQVLKKVIFMICLGIFFYGIFALSDIALLSKRMDISSFFDPNDLAFFFVSLAPLNLFFFFSSSRRITKIFSIIMFVLAIIVILMTGSRGGFLGLLVIFILFSLFKIKGVSRASKIVTLVLVLFVIIMNSTKIDFERLSSITNLRNDYNLNDEFGRIQVWEKAINIFYKHPVFGVGASCFPMAIGEIRETAGLPAKWQETHNAYLQVLSEIGIFGFIFYIILLLCVLINLKKCFWTNPQIPETNILSLLSKVLFIGFIGFIVTTFFLSQAFSIIFTFFIAISVVLRKLNEMVLYSLL